MVSRPQLIGLAAAATLGVVLNVQAGREPGDGRGAFRRPAALDTVDGAVAGDAVWSLGAKLFFDTRLSASQTIACASCHKPGVAWSDHLSKAVGEAHTPMGFRAPTLLNAGQLERYGWSGRFADIKAVAFFAMSAPANMNMPMPRLLARLRAAPDYVAAFGAAFPDGAISTGHLGAALTRYVGSITSGTAPFDRWVAGDPDAISASAVRGFAVFNGKGRCTECHSGWTLTDGSYHDVGTGGGKDVGRGAFFKTSVKLRYAFKTPTLRDVDARGPYMHDGSIATLEAVVDHYDKGGIDRPSRAEAIRPLKLSPQEKSDLVAFLKSLTGGTRFARAAGD